MDKQIRDFRDKIVKEINSSGLPLEVVRLVFLEISGSISAECDRIILEERAKESEEDGNKLSTNNLE
jgi:hypothetical protein